MLIHRMKVKFITFINKISNFYKELIRRRTLKTRLGVESKLAKPSSLEALREFESIEEGKEL